MEVLRNIEEVFAFHLRRHRGDRTQADMAERLELPLRTYVNLEQGKVIPQASTRTLISAVLGVKETSLFADPEIYLSPSDDELIAMLAERLKKPEKVQGREPNILDRLDAKKQLFYTQLIQDMESGDVAALEKELAEFLEKERDK